MKKHFAFFLILALSLPNSAFALHPLAPLEATTKSGLEEDLQSSAVPLNSSPVPFGDELVRILRSVFPADSRPDQRVILAFGGDSIHGLLVPLIKSGEFSVVNPSLAETPLGDVAVGLAQIQGISVVVATYQVGTVQVLTRLAKAISEGVPVILIGGAHPATPTGIWAHSSTSRLANEPDNDMDIRIAREMGIPVVQIPDPSNPGTRNLAQKVQDAVSWALATQRPIFIRILPGAAQWETLRAQNPVPEGKGLPQQRRKELHQVAQQTMDFLGRSSHPLLHVGENLPARLASLVEEVSQELGLSVTVEWGAKGRLSEERPNYLGPYSGEMSTGNPATRRFVEEQADFAIRLGERRVSNFFNTGGMTVQFPQKQVSIAVSEEYPDGRELEFFLTELRGLARERAFKPRTIDPAISFVSQILTPEVRNQMQGEGRKQLVTWRNLHQVLGYFSQNPSHEPPVFFSDISSVWFASQFFPTRGPQAMFSNWSFAEMGPAAPQALAYALAHPGGRLPVYMGGDAAFFMQGLQTLIPAVRLDLPSVFIVFENREQKLGKPSGLPPELEKLVYQTHPETTDLVAMADAMGASGQRVTTVGELLAVLEQAESEKTEKGRRHVHLIVIRDDPRVPIPKNLAVYAGRIRALSVMSPPQPSTVGLEEPVDAFNQGRELANRLGSSASVWVGLNRADDPQQVARNPQRVNRLSQGMTLEIPMQAPSANIPADLTLWVHPSLAEQIPVEWGMSGRVRVFPIHLADPEEFVRQNVKPQDFVLLDRALYSNELHRNLKTLFARMGRQGLWVDSEELHAMDRSEFAFLLGLLRRAGISLPSLDLPAQIDGERHLFLEA